MRNQWIGYAFNTWVGLQSNDTQIVGDTTRKTKIIVSNAIRSFIVDGMVDTDINNVMADIRLMKVA